MSAVICAITLRALLLAALVSPLVATGCSGEPAIQSRDPEVRAFALRMIDVLERDDLDGFRELLSTRMLRTTNDGEVRRMFDAWRHLLVPYAEALREADWTAQADVVRFRTVGSPPTRLAKVVAENGTLRIDEN